MRLAVPDTLKVLLVDDWEAVTKNNQVRQRSPYSRGWLLGQPELAPPCASWSLYLEIPLSRKYSKNSRSIFLVLPRQSKVPSHLSRVPGLFI